MDILRYQIAGHFCEVAFDDVAYGESLMPSYVPFRTTAEGSTLFRMTVDNAFRFTSKGKEVGQFDCGGHNFGVYLLDNGDYQFEISNEKGVLCAFLQANAAFTDNKVALVGNTSSECQFGLNNALMVVYAFAAAPYKTLLIHSSVVSQNGKGYLFLGVSGTGKSTHSRLWLKYIEGSELMNDDNPVVRIVDNEPRVYGSPWSGKTPCYRNVMAPIGGFVQLQQKPENKIRRAGVLDAFASLLPSVSTMKWDKVIYGQICDTISDLIRLIPVYYLGCLPDEAAARLCHATVALNEKQQ